MANKFKSILSDENNHITHGGLRIVGNNESTDQQTAWIRSNGNYIVINPVDGEHLYLNWDTGQSGGSGQVYVVNNVYAEAFYDRGNTAHYLNPSGTSILSTLTMYTAGATETTQINMPRAGFITFYGDNSQSHSISSRNSAGSTADDLRINTYGALFINLDSNNNNSGGADFMIGRHGGQQATISDWAFKIDGETKNVGIGTTSNNDGDLSINAPKLHVQGPTTSGIFNLVARFQGGNDNDNTGAAILVNHSNDRGLLLSAGRKDGDREVAYFDLVSSGGNTTRMFEIGKYGSTYFNKFAKSIEIPVAWDSGTLENNAIYAKNSTDGFGFGNGTGISTWWAWSTENGLRRMIDSANSGEYINLRTANTDRVSITSTGLDVKNSGAVKIAGVDAINSSRNFYANHSIYFTYNPGSGGNTYLQTGTDSLAIKSTSGYSPATLFVDDGRVVHNFSTQSPIYYDKDDTNYYCDPNGQSRLSTLNLGSSPTSGITAGYIAQIRGSVHMTNDDINYVNQLHFNDNLRFVDEGNDNYLKFRWGSNANGGIKFVDGGDALQGYVYGSGNGEFGILDKDGHWTLITDGATYTALRSNNNQELVVYNDRVEIAADLRSPILYDKDDTNYYVNPAGGAVIQTLTIDDYIYHKGDTNTYLYFENDSIKLRTGGTDRLVLNDYEAYFERPVVAPNLGRNNDDQVLFAITEQDTSETIRRKFGNTGLTAITKVDDSTAPADGCFQLTDQYENITIPQFFKVDDNSEYTFEVWVRFVSGSDTSQKLYAGCTFYDLNKSSLGNTQRYWGESGEDIDADTRQDGNWYHFSGTLGPNRGSNVGDIHANAQWMKLILLLNYADNANTVRYCGLKFYKSGGRQNRMFTSIYRKSLGSQGSSSSDSWLGRTVMDTSGNLYTPEKLIHSDDTDTYFSFSAENQISLVAAGTTRLRVEGDVKVLGTTDLNIQGTSRRLQFTAGTGTVRTTTANDLILQSNSTNGLRVSGSDQATIAYVNMQAPIFYDSGNTNYYVDPASSSQLSNIYYNEWIRNNKSSASGLYWESGTPGAGWHIYPPSTSDMYMRSGSSTQGSLRLNTAGTDRGYVYWNNSNQVGFLSNAGGWTLKVDNNGNTFATTSHRAPIFYDSDDTTYFVDPTASTSIKVSGNAYLGRHIDALNAWDGTGNSRKAIFVGWYSDKVILGNNDDGGHDTAYNFNDDAVISVNPFYSYMDITSRTALRSPIFYDSDDTGRYANPGGTSSFGTIHMNNNNLTNVNHITINDPGGGEGIEWLNGNGWKIYESPNDLSNASGNLQFVTTSTRRFTIDTSGNSYSIASSRAPIFYDTNDTNYYTNPNGTSTLSALTLASTFTQNGGDFITHGNQTGDLNSFWQIAGTGKNRGIATGRFQSGASNSFTSANNANWIMNIYSHAGASGAYPYGIQLAGTDTGDRNLMIRGVSNGGFGSWARVFHENSSDLRSPIFYDSNDTNYYIDPNNTGSSVYVKGDVVAYGASDERLKDNIKPIENALDKVCSLSGNTFEWNEVSHRPTGKKDIGVIAQEVEKVFPEIIDTRDSGYKAVDYQKLSAVLIEAIKELKQEVKELKCGCDGCTC